MCTHTHTHLPACLFYCTLLDWFKKARLKRCPRARTTTTSSLSPLALSRQARAKGDDITRRFLTKGSVHIRKSHYVMLTRYSLPPPGSFLHSYIRAHKKSRETGGSHCWSFPRCVLSKGKAGVSSVYTA